MCFPEKEGWFKMKNLPSVKAVVVALIVISCIEFLTGRLEQITVLSIDSSVTTIGNSLIESIMLKNQKEKLEKRSYIKDLNVKQEIEIVSLNASSPEIVFEGMTLEELASKLDLSLSSNLTGYGMSFAKYSMDYGVDPYLSVAISLLETGCTWTCSRLVRENNNVGGMRSGGSYISFDSLDAGIEAMIRNLSNNYIQKGLVTPEQINTRYAESSTWASKVNNYIYKVRNA